MWYKIILNNEDIYPSCLHYRRNKGFYWGGEIFATLFLLQHLQHDDNLICYLKDYDYRLEECIDYYSYYDLFKYHGKQN